MTIINWRYNRIVTVLLSLFFATLFSLSVKASELGPSITQSVSEESFGNVTVTTTTDIGTGIVIVETKTLDPTTGVINNDIVKTNTLTGVSESSSELILPKSYGYIFVGDSRYQGLDLYTKLSSDPNTWVIAEVSKGYNWLKSSAVNKVDEIEANNPQITDWYEIYTLGLNDPRNKDKYVSWYKDRSCGHNVILLSMNPIEHHSSITNELVCSFNEALVATGLSYINCYDFLMKEGFKTADGVHYNPSTDKVINKYVNACVRKISGET